MAFLPVTTLGGAPFRRNRGCVLLTLTQPLILRAISLPDVPFTLSLDNWLGGNPINQRRVITLLGAHDLGINVGRVDFKADIPKISWQPRLTKPEPHGRRARFFTRQQARVLADRSREGNLSRIPCIPANWS